MLAGALRAHFWAAAGAMLVLAWCSVEAKAASVEFVGARGIPEKELRTAIGEQIQDIDAKGLTTARADDAAYFLGMYYRKQGYARVDVKYEVRGARLVLQVSEGPRAFIRQIRFTGNRKHTDAELAEYFSGVKAEKLATEKVPYTEAEVSAGGDRVRGYYLSEGWLDAVVDVSGTRLSGDGTAADVVVAISEGQQYRLGEISFAGEVHYARAELLQGAGMKPEDPRKAEDPLTASLNAPGGPFTPALADAMQGSLRSWLRARGHFNAQVTAEWSKDRAPGGKVPVRFVITAGPVFRVTRVDARGLERVRPEFIQHRFDKITNATYNPEKIDEKYRELLRTGLFRTVHVVPKDDGGGRMHLEMDVEEAKQKEFGFELGYGSYEGLIASVTLGDRNFMRSGRPLTFKVESTGRGFQGELLYVDPWFLDSDWTLRARLYSQLRDELGYSKSAAGLRVEGSRKTTKHTELTAFTEFQVAHISSDEIDPVLLGPLNYRLASLGLAETLDFRDNPLNPKRGFVFTTSLELDALGGTITFGRATTRYSHYYGFKRSLLAWGVRAGWIIPVGDVEDVPIDLRYFNGGGTTVRSFSERDLGPKDKGGHPLGGAFYTVANVEWDFPITTTLGGALFVDAGNLKMEASPGLDDMRFAIGIGLRYELPIGPMRLDYGFNPSPRADEDIGALHFSFGFAF
jgi:outer membrane protein assembly complex protein YaeT